MKHIVRRAVTLGVVLAGLGAVTQIATPTAQPVKAATVAQGVKQADHSYYTITSRNYQLYSSFGWRVKQSSQSVYQRTFLSTGVYHHQNGSTYLSLYDQNGVWQGYINQSAAKKASGAQGVWQGLDGYFSAANAVALHAGFTSATVGSLAAGSTYHVTGAYHWFDGTVYYSVYDANKRWLGYVDGTQLSLTSSAGGARFARSGYAKVNAAYLAWSDLTFAKGTKLAASQVVKLNGEYRHFNGSTYVAITSLANKALGFINAKALTTVTTLEGDKQADDRYVTVTHKYATYSDFNFTPLHQVSDVYQRTYHSVAQYHHANGSTYLALQDASGSFVGYINQNAVSVASGSQGAWMKADAYTSTATIAYADFGLSHAKTTGLSGKTVHLMGMYRRFDGTLLYSAYNNKHQWLGYVDAAKVSLSGAQGRWQAKSGYFATTKQGVSIWSGFNFGGHVSTSTSSYYHHTYQIKGQYHHFNGSTYYSLYDGSGKWLGYVNATNGKYTTAAQGVWYAHSGKYTVAAKGYPVWKGFFTNQVNSTTKLYGKTYTVTGQYRHVNGSLYDSLYSGKTWIGYVNASAMKAYAPKPAYRDWLKPSQSYAYPNLSKYGNINIEVNLAKQQVYIKNNNTVLYTMYCSSGAHNTTPKGHFKIQNRGASFYNASEGMGARYWTSFKDWGVYLFHSVPTNAAGNYITAAAKLLGVRPDSHGCIRLSVPDAKWINGYIKQGTSVYIH